MASLLQQLENNEAVLLMYLADELPADDRAEVDQMLATDAGLRQELARLREAHAAIEPAMKRLDEASRLPMSEPAALRQVGRTIKQWNVDRLAGRQAAPAPEQHASKKWLWYPTGMAAAVLLGWV